MDRLVSVFFYNQRMIFFFYIQMVIVPMRIVSTRNALIVHMNKDASCYITVEHTHTS